MSSRREADEPWASAMVERGMVDRGRPSMRQLALRANLSVETVRRMVFGKAVPEVESVEAVADALGLSATVVSSWIGRSRVVDEPWTPPAEAGLLSPKVRDALNQLIRAMTESEARSDATPIGDQAHVVSQDEAGHTVGSTGKRRQNPKQTTRHTSGP